MVSQTTAYHGLKYEMFVYYYLLLAIVYSVFVWL